VRVRRDVPDRLHRGVVDGAHLLQGQQLAVGPVAGIERLSVDPSGRFAVADDLHVLPQFLRPDGTAFVEQHAHLVEDERVSLQRGGVVGLAVPQVVPDVLGLGWAGQAAHALAQLGDRLFEMVVDALP
jgi:hypothetical protein